MNLIMAGIDFHKTPVSIREKFSFTEKESENFLKSLTAQHNVKGAVIISTCNRTELYVSLDENADIDLTACLIKEKNILNNDMKEKFYIRKNEDAVLYLCEVACGIHSQIIHEEQIVTQVNQAIIFARKCNTSDSVLDTLFRTAVSAGKYSLTNVSVSAVPLSVSYEAVRKLESFMLDFKDKKCVVIGNGKMGRLTAELLVKKNADVYVTLRSYRHGETILPAKTKPVAYDKRFDVIDGADVVVSATRSPHYTITKDDIKKLHKKPAYLVDLALPRDIDEKCREFENVCCLDIDDFSVSDISSEAVDEIKDIALKYTDDFMMWINYKNSVPYIENMKKIISERIINSKKFDAYKSCEKFEDIVKAVAEKSVDMIMGGIKSEITPELMKECCIKINERSRL